MPEEQIKIQLNFQNDLFLYSDVIYPQIEKIQKYSHGGEYEAYARLRPEDFFGNDRPFNVEIGIGNGEFISEYAKANPEQNYLGFEVMKRIFNRAVVKARQVPAGNVRLIHFDATFIVSILEDGCVDNFYVNFPDPWPKKRHRRRRLVNETFLDLARYVLKRDGDLYFTSDFEDYAVEVAMRATEHPNFSQARPAPVALDIEGYPRSKYMRRFLDRNEPIYFVHFRCDKPEGAVLPPPPVEPGFRLLWAVASDL